MPNISQFLKARPGLLVVLSIILQKGLRLLFACESGLGKLTDKILRKTPSVFGVNKSMGDRFYRLLAKHIHPSRLKDEMFQEIQQRNIPLKVSLTNALFVRHYYHAEAGLPEWRIDNKHAGKRFAQELGLRVPKTLQADVSFDRIVPTEGILLKPENGCSGAGVFIVRSLEDITELKTGRLFLSWAELKTRIAQMLSGHDVLADSWMVEEFVGDGEGNVPVDVKFNTFYGQVGWMAEIRKHPNVKYHMMDGAGNTIKSELYQADELFIGKGVGEPEIALAKQISLEIPAPFMRIDFLRGEQGLVLNEFTPRPGVMGYFHEKRDSLYGRMYHEADSRLLNDLLSGKRFEAFHKATRGLQRT